MPRKFEFEILGTTQFRRAFNRVGDHISDLRDVWARVQPAFYKIEEEQFKSEGVKGGGRWKALSPAYAKRKRRLYPGKPILQASGKLYAAMTSESPDSILIKTKDEFAVGTSLPYALAHQKGSGKLPKRPVVSFSNSQKKELQKEMQKGLLAVLQRDPAITSVVDFN